MPAGRERDPPLVLENDLLEAIVGLPTDMFYNTGIATYVWVLSTVSPNTQRPCSAHRRQRLLAEDATVTRLQAS